MTSGNELLEGLVRLTADHDARHLEQSLLKSLHDSFSLATALVVRLDSADRPRVVGRYDPRHREIREETFGAGTDPELREIVVHAIATGEYATTSAGAGRWLSAYPLLGMRACSLCLVFQSAEPLGPEDQEQIHRFLSVYRNVIALMDDARTDALTGLLNRRTFDDDVRGIVPLRPIDEPSPETGERRHATVPGSRAFWLAVVDIDGFKEINGRFGHAFGDEVLILVARILAMGFRDQDLVYRFGGEEFVVLASFPGATEAYAACERLRRRIAGTRFPQVGQVTVSIGVTRFREGEAASALIHEAEQALGYAKAHGKNQVRSYPELAESGEIRPPKIQPGPIELF